MHSRERQCLSRREFIRRGIASFVLSRFPPWQNPSPQDASFESRRIPIGLQLYSVRKECIRDLPATIDAIANMGYEGVELAGQYDLGAAKWRQLLDSNGLKCCGAHVELASLLGENLPRTADFHMTIGNEFLIVPSLPRERTHSRQAWLDTARLFDELAVLLEPLGLRVGYHNHTTEFRILDEDLPWDIFFSSTRPDVVMQLDVGNALMGGVDPRALLVKYPGRATTVHVKEYSRSNNKALVGEGDVVWKEIFDLLRRVGGTEWGIVEYENADVSGLDSIARCLANLRKIGL